MLFLMWDADFSLVMCYLFTNCTLFCLCLVGVTVVLCSYQL